MNSLIAPIIHEPLRHLYKLVFDRAYREQRLLSWRLESLPRYREFSIDFRSWRLTAPDAASFLSTCQQLFFDEVYRFRFPTSRPSILDLGANIGLSVLYFKSLFPEARITALEADPRIFRYLETNLRRNGLEGVELINKAAWNRSTTLPFHSEGADAGRVSCGIEGTSTVEAVDIATIMRSRTFDFIKIDIEGAETEVLPACAPFLHATRYVFVEYHSTASAPQSLDSIISILAQAGFRLHVQPVLYSPSPFSEVRTYLGYDLQLNIFASRPDAP